MPSRRWTFPSSQSSTVFDQLKTGLQAPLAGMGLSFSSSLFGLAGSLILGFLDLQASQAQNRFYNDLENWLSSITDIEMGDGGHMSMPTYLRLDMQNLQRGMERITKQIEGGGVIGSGGGPVDSELMDKLADAVASLVTQMRDEQKMVRQWAQSQQVQQNEIQRLLIRMTGGSAARAARASGRRTRNPPWQAPMPAADARKSRPIGRASSMPWRSFCWSSRFCCRSSWWRSSFWRGKFRVRTARSGNCARKLPN